MAMGAGAPMLGDLKKINLDKSEAEGGAALQFGACESLTDMIGVPVFLGSIQSLN